MTQFRQGEEVMYEGNKYILYSLSVFDDSCVLTSHDGSITTHTNTKYIEKTSYEEIYFPGDSVVYNNRLYTVVEISRCGSLYIKKFGAYSSDTSAIEVPSARARRAPKMGDMVAVNGRRWKIISTGMNGAYGERDMGHSMETSFITYNEMTSREYYEELDRLNRIQRSKVERDGGLSQNLGRGYNGTVVDSGGSTICNDPCDTPCKGDYKYEPVEETCEEQCCEEGCCQEEFTGIKLRKLKNPYSL